MVSHLSQRDVRVSASELLDRSVIGAIPACEFKKRQATLVHSCQTALHQHLSVTAETEPQSRNATLAVGKDIGRVSTRLSFVRHRVVEVVL